MGWWTNDDEQNDRKENNHEAPVTPARAPENKNLATAPRTTPAPQAAPTATDGTYDEKKYGTVRSALSDGTVIQGKLSFDTPVRIDGKLMGEVFSSSVLIVGPQGSVAADVNVETLVVFGSVSGEVKARKRLELHASGEVIGNIETPSLVIEDGAYFEGACAMSAGDKRIPQKSATAATEAKKESEPTKIVSAEVGGVAASQSASKGKTPRKNTESGKALH
ncbi:polymer-forming cytoskeletal protein [bacterium]|nr:polymer-forming cytoskeletal protein [bacterium]